MDNQQQMKTIMTRNNEGVAAFERGDFQIAINELSEAFRMSKALFEGACTNQSISRPQHTFQLLDRLFSHHHGENIQRQCSFDKVEHSSTFIYQTAIYLPNIPAIGTMSNSFYCMHHLAIVSVVLFNLALVYHMAGSSSSLHKATKLYELAFRLQRTDHGGSSQSMIYLMVILNNLGQIYRQVGQKTAADHCFSQLLSMTFFVMDRIQLESNSPEISSIKSNLSHLLLEGFFDSTCHLILSNSSGAAPAA